MTRGFIVLALATALITLLPAPSFANSVVLSGPIAGLKRDGFSLSAGRPCGYVHIVVNSSTTIIANGLRIARGVYAQATGSGSCLGMTASTVTLSATQFGSVPKHVLTGDYLGAPYGSSAFAWSAYAPWLSWGEVEVPVATAIASSGIKTLYYTNPNRQAPGDNMYTSTESTFAHDCTGSRITNIGNNRNLMDPSSTAMWSLWQNVVVATKARAHYDAIFEDDADDIYDTTALPCGYAAATWLSSSNAENASLGSPVIYNGLGVLSAGYGVSSSIGLNATSAGGMMEGCYAQPGSRPVVQGKVWETVENTEILMAQQSKLFFCYANDLSPASASLSARMYTYASFLLTYDLNSSVLWEYFGTPSRFHVQPETALVATGAKVATPATITALQAPSGAYGREYLNCYLAGVAVGPCAVVVNSNYARSYSFPFTGYNHTLVLSGGGILDGGTVSVGGPAPSAVVPPLTGIVAFQ